jgi:hypothetical protein
VVLSGKELEAVDENKIKALAASAEGTRSLSLSLASFLCVCLQFCLYFFIFHMPQVRARCCYYLTVTGALSRLANCTVSCLRRSSYVPTLTLCPLQSHYLPHLLT